MLCKKGPPACIAGNARNERSQLCRLARAISLLPVTFIECHHHATATAPPRQSSPHGRRQWTRAAELAPTPDGGALGSTDAGSRARSRASVVARRRGCGSLDPCVAVGGGRGGGQIPPPRAEAEEVMKWLTFQAEVELAAELARRRRILAAARTSHGWPQPPR
jgi:hypothetical protein